MPDNGSTERRAPTSFLGRGWSFPPTFERNRRTVRMVEDEEDVRQSLMILLSTTLGERLLRPDYGCDLHNFLFEPLDRTSVATVFDVVKRAILLHEPRVRMDDLRMETSQEDGRLDLEVVYTIRSTNTRSNLVFPFYVDEASDAIP